MCHPTFETSFLTNISLYNIIIIAIDFNTNLLSDCPDKKYLMGLFPRPVYNQYIDQFVPLHPEVLLVLLT